MVSTSLIYMFEKGRFQSTREYEFTPDCSDIQSLNYKSVTLIEIFENSRTEDGMRVDLETLFIATCWPRVNLISAKILDVRRATQFMFFLFVLDNYV